MPKPNHHKEPYQTMSNCQHPYDSLRFEDRDPASNILVCLTCGEELDIPEEIVGTEFFKPALDYALIRSMAYTYGLSIVSGESEGTSFELDTRKSLLFEVGDPNRNVWYGIELQPEACLVMDLKRDDRALATYQANDWVRALASGLSSIRITP